MTAGSLFAIKQHPEESLWDYFRRFTAAKSQIRGLSDSTIIDAAKQGVLEGTEFFSKLSRKHITSVEKLMNKFEEYACGEEENMRRRVARGLPPLPARPAEAPALAQALAPARAPTAQQPSFKIPSQTSTMPVVATAELAAAPRAGRDRLARRNRARREVNIVDAPPPDQGRGSGGRGRSRGKGHGSGDLDH